MTYGRPNMSNLRGKEGREIMDIIRSTKPSNLENVRKEAEACKECILTRRRNAK